MDTSYSLLPAIHPSSSILFVCDVQETYKKAGVLVDGGETLIHACVDLIQICRFLDVPVCTTVQYPIAFGALTKEIQDALDTLPPVSSTAPASTNISSEPSSSFSSSSSTTSSTTLSGGGYVYAGEKMNFSMLKSTPYLHTSDDTITLPIVLTNRGIRSVILCGVETHICILQTTLDLLRQGYSVYVVRDAVTSQRTIDHETTIQRLQNISRVIVTTVESLTYELLEDARHPQFKSILGIIKQRNQVLRTKTSTTTSST